MSEEFEIFGGEQDEEELQWHDSRYGELSDGTSTGVATLEELAFGIERNEVPGEEGSAKEVLGEARDTMEEEEETVDEEEADEAFYESEDFEAVPYLSENSTFQTDSVTLFSHGYDCNLNYNLCAIDAVNLVWYTGNVIHIFQTISKKIKFRMSSYGHDIGAIAKCSGGPILAIAENGRRPVILIYAWPTFDVIAVLRGTAGQNYVHMDFNSTAEILASLSHNNADYFLKIWTIQESKVILSTRISLQTVSKVQFASYDPEVLVTTGPGHFTFWEMANTITGLKLKSTPARFGFREKCHVKAICFLSDDRILTNSDNGNLLVWDGGVLQTEIRRKDGLPCHGGDIIFIYSYPDENHLFTAGEDGIVKVWPFRKFLNLEQEEAEDFVEMEPSYERRIKNYVGDVALPFQLVPRESEKEPCQFYVQDRNGGIWLIDFELQSNALPWSMLYQCHSGPITGVDSCPVDSFFATVGLDGKIIVYWNDRKAALMFTQFNTPATAILWLPLHADSRSSTVVVGFQDGTLRLLMVSMRAKLKQEQVKESGFINVLQAVKPHTKELTAITCHPRLPIIVTGSADASVFIFLVESTQEEDVLLAPVGQVTMPGCVTCITWNPAEGANEFLASCNGSYLVEMSVSEDFIVNNFKEASEIKTYILDVPSLVVTRLTSVKCRHELRELIEKFQQNKDTWLENRRNELQLLKTALSDKWTMSDLMSEDSSQWDINEADFLKYPFEHEYPQEVNPSEPSPIYIARHLNSEHILVCAGGDDSGFIYVYKKGDDTPLEIIPIEHKKGDKDVVIQYCTEIIENEYMVWGLSNGKIRIVRIKQNPLDFSDYWELTTHRSVNHKINQLKLRYDLKYIYSCGTDSAIFSYKLNFLESKVKERVELSQRVVLPRRVISGMIQPNQRSIQEEKAYEEEQKARAEMRVIRQRIQTEMDTLMDKFKSLQSQNDKLPKNMRIPATVLTFNPFIDKKLDKCQTKIVKKLLSKHRNYYETKWKKQGYQLKKLFVKPIQTYTIVQRGIKTPLEVRTFKEVRLGKKFEEAEKIVQILIKDEQKKLRVVSYKDEEDQKNVENVVPLIPPDLIPDYLSLKGQQLLEMEKYSLAQKTCFRRLNNDRIRRIQRKKELEKIKASGEVNPDMPIADIQHDVKAYIENFKLKTAPTYRAPKHEQNSVNVKFADILVARRKIFETKQEFNEQVLRLRDEKIKLVVYFKLAHEQMNNMKKEFDFGTEAVLPQIPPFDIEKEYPELLLKKKIAEFPNFPEFKDYDSLCRKEWENIFGPGAEIFKIVDTRENRIHLPKMNDDEIDYKMLISLKNNVRQNPFTLEIMRRRKARHITRINYMKMKMINDISQYDETLVQLSFIRRKYEEDIYFQRLHNLKLLQELDIIRNYKTMEDAVAGKREEMLIKKHLQTLRYNVKRKKVANLDEDVQKCKQRIQEIQQEFTEMIKNHDYVKHLSRVFKRKYKPPREHDDDSESSSSESSSEEEEEEYDDDDLLTNMGALYLFDERIKPEDCDQETFDKTFKLRSQRHEQESKISEINSRKLAMQKQVDAVAKTLRIIESILAIYHNEVDSFMSDKQEQLNNIPRVVVMWPSQLQNYQAQIKTLASAKKSIVVGRSSMLRLVNEVEQLKEQTKTFEKANELNKRHTKRLLKSVEAMKIEYNRLKEHKEEEIRKKFGTIIDIENMEISVLMNMIDAVENDYGAVYTYYVEEINQMKAQLREKQDELSGTKKESTKVMQMLYTIKGEHNKAETELKRMRSKRGQKTIDISLKKTFNTEDLQAMLRQEQRKLKAKDEYKDALLEHISILKSKAPSATLHERMIARKVKEAKETMTAIEAEEIGGVEEVDEDEMMGDLMPDFGEGQRLDGDEAAGDVEEEVEYKDESFINDAGEIIMTVVKKVLPSPITSMGSIEDRPEEAEQDSEFLEETFYDDMLSGLDENKTAGGELEDEHENEDVSPNENEVEDIYDGRMEEGG